jgi:hypothetical protein
MLVRPAGGGQLGLAKRSNAQSEFELQDDLAGLCSCLYMHQQPEDGVLKGVHIYLDMNAYSFSDGHPGMFAS